MTTRLDEVKKKLNVAKSARKKGDALRRARREEAACDAYNVGISALKDALVEIDSESAKKQLNEMSSAPSGARGTLFGELIEIFGSRGGLFQRLGMLKEALESYSEGAWFEKHCNLPSTYNRLNAVKYSLLVGDKRLHELEPQIKKIADHIEVTLQKDRRLSDSGWAWADLGDCMTLLGQQEKAKKAYTTFISKAEIKSPERTLDVLKEIATKLKALQDPDAPRLQAAIDTLNVRLKT